MSEFELRVRPSGSPNDLVWFYALAVERGGLRVESSLRAMDLEALRRSCERPVGEAAPAGVPLVVASRDRREACLVMEASGVRVSLPVDADQRHRLRDLCEQGLSMDDGPRTAAAREHEAVSRPAGKDACQFLFERG